MSIGPFKLPDKSEARWSAAEEWLIKHCYLPSKLIDNLYRKGELYASETGQIVFVERERSGAIAGATFLEDDCWQRLSRSEECAAFYVVAPIDSSPVDINRIVITDNPVEALSKQLLEGQLEPTKYLALSTVPAAADHARGIGRVEIAMSDPQAAQAVLKVIPNAVCVQTLSPQVQLKETLRSALSPLKQKVKAQSRTRQKDLDKSRDLGY